MVEQDIQRRVPYGVWIEGSPGDIPAFYLAHDLSTDGLWLRARHPPPTGITYPVRLVVENEPRVMTLKGEVVRFDRADERDSFMVRFVQLDEAGRAFIDELLAETQ